MAVNTIARDVTPTSHIHQSQGGLVADSRTAPQGADASGGEAAARLEKRTHLDGGDYRITLRDYGNGLAEVGWAFTPSIPYAKVGKGLSDQREANEDRAIRRARSNLRRKILTASADHLLTLTYRENVTDFEKAGDDLSRFVRLVKARLPAWIYVAVAEQQKRGAWHWHLAVCGRQDVAFLRAAWRQVVGEGNIDVNPPKAAGKHRQLALVKYLGKYLAKGFKEGQRELNGRRFRSSLGISVPCQMIPLPPEYRHDVAGYAAGQLMLAAGSVGHVWESEELPAGWACSWS
jgi:hypothetical protein